MLAKWYFLIVLLNTSHNAHYASRRPRRSHSLPLKGEGIYF
jgi:hypothetical protein